MLRAARARRTRFSALPCIPRVVCYRCHERRQTGLAPGNFAGIVRLGNSERTEDARRFVLVFFFRPLGHSPSLFIGRSNPFTRYLTSPGSCFMRARTESHFAFLACWSCLNSLLVMQAHIHLGFLHHHVDAPLSQVRSFAQDVRARQD